MGEFFASIVADATGPAAAVTNVPTSAVNTGLVYAPVEEAGGPSPIAESDKSNWLPSDGSNADSWLNQSGPHDSMDREPRHASRTPSFQGAERNIDSFENAARRGHSLYETSVPVLDISIASDIVRRDAGFTDHAGQHDVPPLAAPIQSAVNNLIDTTTRAPSSFESQGTAPPNDPWGIPTSVALPNVLRSPLWRVASDALERPYEPKSGVMAGPKHDKPTSEVPRPSVSFDEAPSEARMSGEVSNRDMRRDAASLKVREESFSDAPAPRAPTHLPAVETRAHLAMEHRNEEARPTALQQVEPSKIPETRRHVQPPEFLKASSPAFAKVQAPRIVEVPGVQIGQIDVFVAAPAEAPANSRPSTGSSSYAVSRYLRRL